MDYRFVQVSFFFPGVPKIRDLEPHFSALGDDWVRYSATNWIVWTSKSVVELYQVLRPRVDFHDQIFIASLNISDSVGFLSPWIWEWIRSKGVDVKVAVDLPLSLTNSKPQGLLS